MSFLTRMAAGIAVATAALSGAPALAQGYPDHPVEFIVPWAPGGGSDILMRLIATDIPPYLGADMPVINIPGVGGTVGLKDASKRKPDGYTISQVHEGLLTATATGITDLKWDDFDPIALMTASPQYLVIAKDRPYKTFEELIAYAKENPGKVTMGVTLGGVPHLHAAMIADAFGVEFSYVGYEGTGERIRALVGGNLDAAIGDIASAGEFAKNGDVIFVAVGTPERVEAAPDVPTFKELGADLSLMITRGIVMPKGAPEEVQAKMESALEELSKDPKYIEQTNNAGADVMFSGREAYRKYLSDLAVSVDKLAAVLAP